MINCFDSPQRRSDRREYMFYGFHLLNGKHKVIDLRALGVSAVEKSGIGIVNPDVRQWAHVAVIFFL